MVPVGKGGRNAFSVTTRKRRGKNLPLLPILHTNTTAGAADGKVLEGMSHLTQEDPGRKAKHRPCNGVAGPTRSSQGMAILVATEDTISFKTTLK